ncbi:hypothetical protein BZB76_2682 [Actinomadura pelletieri DSM 43383]|uniref:Uncharacterized protein n=1 Tax=Actinomadura pelletieri DSM 43383 TaxID=1120940 RepID=A0A495QV39_9ACTN|nr:hypothetical protein [Actinomadura pelletieri]RKS77301.1 hypothetical protein BZB76_2682 [Actinomadura pelletieri DSM 43383]
MADSPSRSDTPDSASPWGDARPWWTADHGGDTGPHGMVPDATGPQLMIGNMSGGYPVVPVAQGGTGPLPLMPVPPPSGPALPGPALPGSAPQGPPSPARRRPLRLVLVAGAAMVASAVLMAGVLAFRMESGGDGGGKKVGTTGGAPASRKVIDAGPVAGGLRRDVLTSPPASAAYPFVVAAVRATGIPVAERGQAVYTEGPGRPLNVLFVGGTGSVGDPAAFLRRARPTTFIAGQGAEPGVGGGTAVCGTFAVLAETHTYCAWATEDSYGVVASNRPTLNPHFPLMAEIMRRIRQDVERPR